METQQRRIVVALVIAVFLCLIGMPVRVLAQEAFPPILLTPYNETGVSDRFVTWSWLMQPKSSTGEAVVCDLRVVEILSSQTPEEAIRVNPPVFQKNDLRSSVWQAGLGTRSLIPGHRYAWQITARSGDKIVSASEIWSFVFTEPVGEDTAAARSKAPGTSIPLHKQESISARLDARLTSETSNKPGKLSEGPKNFTRLEFDPTITINGAPLQLSFLLSSEQNAAASPVNRGAFMYRRDAGGMQLGLDARIGNKLEELKQSKLAAMRDSIQLLKTDTTDLDRNIAMLESLHDKDPREKARALEEFGMASETDPFFLDIPSLGLGAVAPQFTGLTLSGVTMNGVLAEYNPGNLYLAGAIGKAPRWIVPPNLPPPPPGPDGQVIAPQFFHNVYAARIGYGRKEKNNVVLSAVYFGDDEQSRLMETLLDTTPSSFAPQENFLLGLSGQSRFDEFGLVLDGEINTTLFTEKVSGFRPREERLRGFVTRVFGAGNVSEQTLGDIAYAGRAQQLLFGRTATLTADVRMIGPSYRTMGVVGLRTDVFGFGLRFAQNLIGNTLAVSGLLGREESGFVVKDPGTSRLATYGVGTELRLHDLPSMQLGYTINNQNQTLAADSGARTTVLHFVTASSRYWTRFGDVRTVSLVSYSLQKATSTDRLTDFTSSTLLLNTKLSLAFPLSAIITLSHTKTTSAGDTADQRAVVSTDVAFLYDAPAGWQNVAGASYSSNRQAQTRSAFLSSRVGISGIGEAELRAEYTEFASSLAPQSEFADRTLRMIIRLQL